MGDDMSQHVSTEKKSGVSLIEHVYEALQEALAHVEQNIADEMTSDVPAIQKISRHILQAKRKKLRSIMLILSAQMCCYTGTAHTQLATVIEFIHAATLLHDDVIDASQLRRGQKTANVLYGNSASILAGDFLYSRSFQIMAKIDNMDVMRILADITNTIATGEIMELVGCFDVHITEQEYLKIVSYKTAMLFAASGHLGAILGQTSVDQQDALRNYGYNFGLAFQLVDDVLDYVGHTTSIGKNVGDDFAEKKITLPVIYAMAKGSATQRELLQSIFRKNGHSTFNNVVTILYETGAFQYVRQLAQQYVTLAKDQLAVFADSTAKSLLVDMAHFALNRHQ